MNRIHHRNRDGENSYTIEYLTELEKSYYYQIHSQMIAKHSNIVVISNKDFYEAKSVLDILLTHKNTDDFDFDKALTPNDNITPEQIRDGFDKLCEYFSN
jgi:hypothetical protein